MLDRASIATGSPTITHQGSAWSAVYELLRVRGGVAEAEAAVEAGLRVGYVVAPAPVIERLVVLRSAPDL